MTAPPTWRTVMLAWRVGSGWATTAWSRSLRKAKSPRMQSASLPSGARRAQLASVRTASSAAATGQAGSRPRTSARQRRRGMVRLVGEVRSVMRVIIAAEVGRAQEWRSFLSPRLLVPDPLRPLLDHAAQDLALPVALMDRPALHGPALLLHPPRPA